MGPLKGLKVVEMAGIGPCPLAGQLLADLGADVVVIDRQDGADFSRDVNRRGKRSIVLDLKSETGMMVALRLAAASDALIEGYRPGVMERLGLGPDDCRGSNARLVYGRMTGWGQEGPLSRRAGHDINYLGTTGALHAMGGADRPPEPPLNLVADYGGGAMLLVTGVLAALWEAGRSGQGQVVDAAMVDGVPALMGLIHTMLAAGSWTNRRHANLLDGAAPFYRCYETEDGKFVSVGSLEPQFFAEMVGRLGLDPSWNRRRNDPANWPALAKTLTALFRTKPRDAWAALFADSDACVFPVLDFEEAPTYPHHVARGGFTAANGVAQASPAPRFSRTACAEPVAGGRAGEHCAEILAELGFDGETVRRFVADLADKKEETQ